MGAPSGSIDVYPASRGPYADAPGYTYGWQITSYFGGRIDPITGQQGSHGGEDQAYYGCGGAPIIAPISGLLSQGWDSSGGGNWSGLSGDNGDYWGFGHAASFVWPGGGSRWVEAGDVIAYTDSTGGSTGAHNHIAYRPRGASGYRDPHDVLVACAAAMGGGGGSAPGGGGGSGGGTTPAPLPPTPEVTNMLPAPRTSWVTKSGAWYALTPDGRFVYIGGPGALVAMQTPHEGWPPEIGAPIEIDDGVEHTLADFYNAGR
jgi:murein DD-endopeptidase MepM/ murein hydrolase activator NlpD